MRSPPRSRKVEVVVTPEPGSVHTIRSGSTISMYTARVGYRTLRLSVGDENPEAKAFWERIGFAEVGRLDRGVSVYEKRIR